MLDFTVQTTLRKVDTLLDILIRIAEKKAKDIGA